MSFRILVTKHGQYHFHTAACWTRTRQTLIDLFQLIDEAFPEAEGYLLSAHHDPGWHRMLTAATFRTLARSDDPYALLQGFFDPQEFAEFLAQERTFSPQDAAKEYAMDGLENHENVSEVLLYYPTYYIAVREHRPKKYLLPGYTELESNDLKELQCLLFLSFLVDGN